MTGALTRFRIEGLHNLRTIDIPIIDNKLVLVGENGTGKSTVANYIYYVLTMQWSMMLGNIFKSISIDINGREYLFERSTVRRLASLRRLPNATLLCLRLCCVSLRK